MYTGDGPSRQLDVAIVDDEAMVRVAVRRLCEALGFTATTYCGGREFLEMLHGDALRPDCLLLDLRMSEMTGLELHGILIRRGVHIPTVVITADDTPEMRARCVAAGLPEYLRKPAGADDLLAAMQRAMEREPHGL